MLNVPGVFDVIPRKIRPQICTFRDSVGWDSSLEAMTAHQLENSFYWFRVVATGS